MLGKLPAVNNVAGINCQASTTYLWFARLIADSEPRYGLGEGGAFGQSPSWMMPAFDRERHFTKGFRADWRCFLRGRNCYAGTWAGKEIVPPGRRRARKLF